MKLVLKIIASIVIFILLILVLFRSGILARIICSGPQDSRHSSLCSSPERLDSLAPSSDQGVSCYEDSECEINCVSINETDEEGFIKGRCGKYSITSCVPTIPVKTKDKTMLNRGSCV